MNREKIVKDLNKWVKKEFGSLYSVKDDGDLTLICTNGRWKKFIAWFDDFDATTFDFQSPDYGSSIDLLRKGIIEKFYDKAIELMSNYEPKYTIQVIKGNEHSYINMDKRNKKIIFDNRRYLGAFLTEFTKSEIEKLKKRDDVAIDWDKAIIKEAVEEDNSDLSLI